MRLHATSAVVVAAALAACGSSDAGPTEDDSDKRALALECLTEEKEREARLQGDEEIVLSDGTRIRFFLTASEAEVAQFRGEAEGTEQIGAALVSVEPVVRPETEELLEDVESCLGEL